MGNLTLVLLLSTWTTPSVLVLLLPRLLPPIRTQPSPLQAPLLRQAHEHKKTGRAPRRSLLPQPQYQRPRHRKNNAPLPLLLCLKPPPFWSPSCHVSAQQGSSVGLCPLSLSLSLAPGQGRARPPLPSVCVGCRTVWQGPAGGCRGHGADEGSTKESKFTQSLQC